MSERACFFGELTIIRTGEKREITRVRMKLGAAGRATHPISHGQHWAPRGEGDVLSRGVPVLRVLLLVVDWGCDASITLLMTEAGRCFSAAVYSEHRSVPEKWRLALVGVTGCHRP